MSTGVWVLLAVITSLFALCLAAYVMRLASADATAIALPWQLWLSTGLLVLGSVMLQRAARGTSQRGLMAGGLCGVAFVAVQCWAWQALQADNVVLTGNPAASFFYLLTGLHALHAVGGLVAWGQVSGGQAGDRRVALCARYWHFLLAVWLALFAAFRWITPDVARVICGVPS
jgi:cytochrome c oxidase subunit 3